MIGQRNAKQMTCPLCSSHQDKIFDGHYFDDQDKRQVLFDKDNGFAFCNCNNVFFGDWKNIEQSTYDSDYTKKYNNPVTTQYFIKYFETYKDIIKGHKKSGRFVEIGCVNQALLDCFKSVGYETYSLDIIHHEWEGHKNITCDFEKYRTDDKFAVVWASHVFEHFKDPVAAFKSVYDILEDGGVAFIAMPDPYFIDLQQPYTWGHWHVREHHVMWEMDSLCSKLEEIGFKVIDAIHNVGTGFICSGDYHILVNK